MYDVVSLGSATVDIFAKSDQFSIIDNYLSLPSSSKSEISHGLISSGGGATNSAVSFSKLNLKSAVVAETGNDALNTYIFSDLKAASVDTTLISVSPDGTTDYSLILVAPDGSRSILTNRGSTQLKDSQIKWDKIKNTSWFYISSLEGNIDLLEKIIGFAIESNIKIALNPGSRELKQSYRLSTLFKFINLLLLNQEEAEELAFVDFNDATFWKKLSSTGSQIIAVTRGSQGAHVISDNKVFYSPVISVDVIDETGAGDAFGSAFVAALHHKMTIENSLFWAIKNSASVVSSLGAKSGLLTLSEIR